MKYVVLPEDKPRRLSFYLAMEEYIARHLKEPECFFMWQVEPSVIFGRNQLIENEVNLAYCKEHGIQMFRRKSGGGCVYADRSNVMFSYITSAENVAFTFSKYMGRVVFMLQRLGLETAANGRNDVMIGDRKYDLCGADAFGIDGIGVLYGFGSEEELKSCPHVFLAKSAEAFQQETEASYTLLTFNIMNIGKINQLFGPTEGDKAVYFTAQTLKNTLKGTNIYAAYDGVVVAATYSSTMGNYVMIDHGDGLYTIYMHASKLYVKVGDKVSQGQTIAAVGSTGYSTGPHLHFSVIINGNYVDPLKYLP